MTTYFETDEFESDEYEEESDGFLGEMEGLFGEVDSPLSEIEELEWASQLLEISDEEELEEFLGKLFKKVAKGVGGFIKSPIGKALGGALKSVAKKALPMVGGALGSMVAPGIGTALGSKLGGMASKLFELEEEFETMDAGELELEVAKRYVRLASTAARNAATAPPGADPRAVAKKAIVTAAKTHAPGLVSVIGVPGRTTTSFPTGGAVGSGRARTGRWVRRGNKIIVLGV